MRHTADIRNFLLIEIPNDWPLSPLQQTLQLFVIRRWFCDGEFYWTVMKGYCRKLENIKMLRGNGVGMLQWEKLGNNSWWLESFGINAETAQYESKSEFLRDLCI